jgi:drug/metabolite transporter (DMT)-like permease
MKMTDEQLRQYNEKRNVIIKEFRAKTLKTVGLVAGGCLLALLLWILLFFVVLENMQPVGIVICLVTLLFCLIMGWMKVLTFNAAKQKKLHEFEERSLLNQY